MALYNEDGRTQLMWGSLVTKPIKTGNYVVDQVFPEGPAMVEEMLPILSGRG